jgi:site-specific recombinase XerD
MKRNDIGMTEGYQERNQELIKEFLGTLHNLSEGRILRYRVTLNKMSRDFGKAFDGLTQDDLREYLEMVSRRGDYSEWTKLGYRQFVKRFFGWLRDPSFIEWVRLGRAWSRVSVADLLTDPELQALGEPATI